VDGDRAKAILTSNQEEAEEELRRTVCERQRAIDYRIKLQK
jgi:hypothetical protein